MDISSWVVHGGGSVAFNYDLHVLFSPLNGLRIRFVYMVVGPMW